MEVVGETVAGPEVIETQPWWRSKLNLGAVALAIAVLCGALGWVIGNNTANPDPDATTHRLGCRDSPRRVRSG